MRSYKFTLTGTMPLLMHEDSIIASDIASEWRTDPANKNLSIKGDDRSPPWTWQGYTYNDGEHVVMPSANIAVALRDAGKQLILKKSTTFKKLTQSGMLIRGEFCDFLCRGKQIPWSSIMAIRELSFIEQCKKVKDLGFELHGKRAKVGQAKHVRIRPKFAVWSVVGAIEVTADEITTDILRKLFVLSGQQGLCDWRPGCGTPGPFGQFKSSLEEIS